MSIYPTPRTASAVFVAVLLVLVALAAVLITVLAFDTMRGNGVYPFPGSGSASGCNSGVCVVAPSYSVLSPAELQSLAQPTAGITVDPTQNAVRVSASGATLFVQAEPSMPNAQGDYFVLYGLVNPTVLVPRGLAVHVVASNLDDGSPHNFGLTTTGPPYGSVPPMMGGHWPMMSPWLGPGNATRGYPSYSATLQFPSDGTWYYICSIPGHAQDGMFGTLEVTD